MCEGEIVDVEVDSGAEAGNVRCDVVNLLVRFRVMDIGKALLSTHDLCRSSWETVFSEDCSDVYLVRKASGTRITLVKTRCAWYLRAKIKSHGELPYAEGEEFMEVMSLDRGAGVRPVQEGGSSRSSGPQQRCPMTSRESASVKKLVAPSVPTADEREEHTVSGHVVFRTWCRECCIGCGRMHQHRAP